MVMTRQCLRLFQRWKLKMQKITSCLQIVVEMAKVFPFLGHFWCVVAKGVVSSVLHRITCSRAVSCMWLCWELRCIQRLSCPFSGPFCESSFLHNFAFIFIICLASPSSRGQLSSRDCHCAHHEMSCGELGKGSVGGELGSAQRRRGASKPVRSL